MGHWHPHFGLLVMSPQCFKDIVGSLIRTWWRCMHYMFPEIHLWCNTSQPFGGQNGSWADLFHLPATRHWCGSNGRPTVPQVNILPTRKDFHKVLQRKTIWWKMSYIHFSETLQNFVSMLLAPSCKDLLFWCKRESDIAYRWVHRESNLAFTFRSDKDERTNCFYSV